MYNKSLEIEREKKIRGGQVPSKADKPAYQSVRLCILIVMQRSKYDEKI